MNAIIKYPGAKWRIAKWIIDFFPKHHSYLEPFFGSGAVLFNKQRSNIETVNDLDGDIVNFFEWVRNDPEKLCHAIRWTPYARDVYNRAWGNQHKESDSFRRAYDFSIRMMMGHGFRTTGEHVGWKNDVQGREAAYAVDGWNSLPNRIIDAAQRLKYVQIENRPAVEVINRFNAPNVLIYADPPYLLNVRYGKQYKCEMSSGDHGELLEVLRQHKGPVILSGYDNQMYNDVLRDWHKEEISSRTQSAKMRREVIWMNFEPVIQKTMLEMMER